MSLSIYSTGSKSKPKRKAAPEPTSPTPAIGRRVKRRKMAKPTNGSKPRAAAKPKKMTKARKATAPSKTAKPATTAKKTKTIKPKSTAKRQAIPPAKRTKHRVKSTAEKSVAFSLSAPAGLDVSITGTFNNWEPQALTKGPDGLWQIALKLSPGRYQYRFVVDTVSWQDPNNPRKIANEHGSFNSVCEVM